MNTSRDISFGWASRFSMAHLMLVVEWQKR
jgi:hypothetical protein